VPVSSPGLIKTSIACSVLGLVLIYAFSCMVEPKAISINLLDRYSGRIVRVNGTIVDLRTHEAGHIFVKIKDESGICEIPLFRDLAGKVPKLTIGDRLEVVGTVEEYNDSPQVVPRSVKDIRLLETPPVPIGEAIRMVGETIKLQGIAYAVTDSDKGQEFYLTDGDGEIYVSVKARRLVQSGWNITLSGIIKAGEDGPYLAASEILNFSEDGLQKVGISDLPSRTGVMLVQGSLRTSDSGVEIDDGTDRLPLKVDLAEGMVEGDIVDAIVKKKGDRMNVLEVELNKASILPLERLGSELIGKTVRIKGTVVDKFVSGKNAFLTLYNATEVEVPVFGVGQDFNVQLGDVLTVSGRVGLYRDKLQVVPRNLSDVTVEPGRIADKDLDQLSMEDVYSLVRVRGRISSVKRYAKSCSIWIKGETNKVRVYLTFDPGSNASVGTEVEVIGLVKSYEDEIELVPRGEEDLG